MKNDIRRIIRLTIGHGCPIIDKKQCPQKRDKSITCLNCIIEYRTDEIIDIINTEREKCKDCVNYKI